MPKKRYDFRLSEQDAQIIEEYRVKFDLKTSTEALERILLRHKYYQSVIDRIGVSKPVTDEELACTDRIELNGNHYCIYSVPRNVKLSQRLLETLEICVVCKTRKLGLTEKTIVRSEPVNFVKEPVAPRSPFSSNESGSDRAPSFKQNPRIRGNIYCPDGGFWVWPAKCVICKRDTYTKWNDCTAHEPVQ